ncbi:hypothetical protein CMT41_01395 [Colwellia sp. MT41]|uniref:hydrolase 1, exosortase A system-associated n=1 Tax=Colwellia sp. MT41 TaxID=58049 RepID=UPI000717ABD9|nr:hydrolase 1, exosortase A system-associated [Colwellia sp. MT41]ALO33522.1 hypothetical protein CMT41_01395 [Colwellia sp. MT41]
MLEQGVIFNSKGKQLIAIEHLPMAVTMTRGDKATKKGVIIVVGGPQTRVGSHRLFVYLARALAKQGLTVFRFDYSGAGDSEGELSTFTDIQSDIDAAIQTFQQRHSDITDLALWGLCDAASAILLYLNGNHHHQEKITQLFLVNPWVRQVQTQAKTFLRTYYFKRLISNEFWRKLVSGKVRAKVALSEINQFHQQGKASNNIHPEDNFVTQMLQGLSKFTGQSHIILSGNDLTADEFRLLVKSNKHWQQVMAQASIEQKIISQADHTFSQRDKQDQLIEFTVKALVT